MDYWYPQFEDSLTAEQRESFRQQVDLLWTSFPTEEDDQGWRIASAAVDINRLRDRSKTICSDLGLSATAVSWSDQHQ
jgi:hypothetical protein